MVRLATHHLLRSGGYRLDKRLRDSPFLWIQGSNFDVAPMLAEDKIIGCKTRVLSAWSRSAMSNFVQSFLFSKLMNSISFNKAPKDWMFSVWGPLSIRGGLPRFKL